MWISKSTAETVADHFYSLQENKNIGLRCWASGLMRIAQSALSAEKGT